MLVFVDILRIVTSSRLYSWLYILNLYPQAQLNIVAQAY